ncbi:MULTISPECIES: TFIIS helical bundle-like domain containing protein [Methylobacterium]|uniref:TFIIS helical bundle-like domain containing protein n=1 Tax=Methylobacterium TaxID=407 RepID=UPI0013ECEB1D|nr:TFIIS helical bundle-like domain containing protein [Methylobacterium sp. DB0501]NGM34446.1 TFIIS helical bundle-like domain containing protein [Methylobacterium sp. DB0501]
MSLIGRIVTKILGNDDPRIRPDGRGPYDDRANYGDSGNLVGRLVTKILRR